MRFIVLVLLPSSKHINEQKITVSSKTDSMWDTVYPERSGGRRNLDERVTGVYLSFRKASRHRYDVHAP